ncbi:MAG TPA: PHP domain-containing protein [Candidatus Krumholzibacteria bacterium]|nr:PHP domain-containing protein [Candidatus Krumholzibacteria bacterium]
MDAEPAPRASAPPRHHQHDQDPRGSVFHDGHRKPNDDGAQEGDEPLAAPAAPECKAARTGHFTLEEVTALHRPSRFDLVRPCDIRGILHSHTRYCDGAHSLESMVETAREIGLEYLGISDHFRTEVHRDGLDVDEVRAQRLEIDALRPHLGEFELLQGVELDANADGTLPVDDATLALFDYVIVSFPTVPEPAPISLTERVCRVARMRRVSIIGKPVGECMLRTDCNGLDMDAVIAAAAAGGTALEINAHPQSPELDWAWCRRAQDKGVALAISPDAHRAARIVDYRHGAQLAQAAGICCASILNTLSAEQLRRYLVTGAMPEA